MWHRNCFRYCGRRGSFVWDAKPLGGGVEELYEVPKNGTGSYFGEYEKDSTYELSHGIFIYSPFLFI